MAYRTFWTALLLSALMACRTAGDLNQTYLIPGAEPEAVGISEAGLMGMDSVFRAYTGERQVPAVEAIIIRNEKMVYHEAYGFRDLASNDPLQKNSIFRMASMTKPVTIAAALILFEEGKFGLDDPIADYIPAFANAQVVQDLKLPDSTYTTVPAERPVTIRDLMTHRAGIGYVFIQPEAALLYSPRGVIDGLTTDSILLGNVIDSLGGAPLLHQPGQNWTYGLSIDVIGRLVEVVSGQDLATFMQERIFDPLGMDDTQFYQPNEKANRLVSVYVPGENGEMISLADLPSTSRLANYPVSGAKTYYSGGAGLSSTAEDYARFALMLEAGGVFNGKRLLKESSVWMMASNQLDPAVFGEYQFGLGVSVHAPRAGALEPDLPGRFGWGGYFKTRYWSDPSEDLVIVMLCQMGPSGAAADEMLDKAMKLAFQSLIRKQTP